MCAKKNPSYMNTCKVYYDERQIAVFTEGQIYAAQKAALVQEKQGLGHSQIGPIII